MAATTCWGCCSRGLALRIQTSPGCRGAITGALNSFSARYSLILAGLNAALHSDPGDETLMVMTSYNPFSGVPGFNTLDVLVEQALLGSDGVIDCSAGGSARGLNDIISCQGAAFGVTVVDAHPLFDGLALSRTHMLEFLLNIAPLPFAIHPNDLGYFHISEAFKAAF